MGDDFSNLGQWRHDIERRVSNLESTVKLEAGRRADMGTKLDDILVKVKAHEKSLNALRETQAEQGQTLTEIKGRLGNVESDVSALKKDMGTVKVGVHAILDLLNTNLAQSGDAADDD